MSQPEPETLTEAVEAFRKAWNDCHDVVWRRPLTRFADLLSDILYGVGR